MRRFHSILYLFALYIGISQTYDTGHHSDLTRNAMMLLGYSPDAQMVGAVSNWLVDYFSYTVGDEATEDLKSMHFDNLFHLTNISNYMTQLVKNSRNATQFVVQSNNPISYLTLVGMTLHAIQDFYTHSSWAEHHQTSCGCYRDDTFFTDLAVANGSISALYDRLSAIRTYSWGGGCNEFERNCLPGQLPHGDYCEGINKDSYVRPWFERSYGHSMAASIEWIYNLEQWAISMGGQGLVDAARSYSAGADLEAIQEDYRASITVSYATKIPLEGEEDGHYKGAGSGSSSRFAAAGAAFYASNSILKQQFEELQLYKYVTYPNLYDAYVYGPNNTYSEAVEYIIPYYQLPADLTSLRKVKVRTTHVRVNKRLGRPSPYAKVIMNGMEFIEAVQNDMEDFQPHWTSILYVPSTVTNVTVQYELWNDRFPVSDEIKEISDGDGILNFVFDIATHQLTGELTGVYDGVENSVTSETADNSVSLYVTENQAGKCVLNGLPEPFCPTEAYTELRTFSGCGITGTAAAEAASASAMTVFPPMILISMLMFFFL